MRDTKIYEAKDRMAHLIRENYDVLQSLSAFGIPLGFGDRTVDETCRYNGVDTDTFLSVVNLAVNDVAPQNLESLSLDSLLRYLEASHRYYLEFQLPSVGEELLGCINHEEGIGRLILEVYDGYDKEIRRHMQYEGRMLFPYVKKLMRGEDSSTYSVDDFVRQHGDAEKNLSELKQLIIKYLPSDIQDSHRLTSALCHIYSNEEWLKNHQKVEDLIFVPMVRALEQKVRSNRITSAISRFASAEDAPGAESVSDREKEVIVCVVQGMSNKQIAEHLCISLNTVVTHRKNIARKLQIHSPAGLTIYAIVNNLVDLEGLNK